MNNSFRIPALIVLFAVFLSTSGCVTGIVDKPDLKKLAYDKDGVLRYDGEKVEGIKIKLPWYKEMWPDNAAEWGFTLVTAGISGAAAGSGGGSSEGSSETIEAPVAVTTTTSSSKPRPKPSPTTTTSTSDSGGGGGGGSAPPPPSGGGFELPF